MPVGQGQIRVYLNRWLSITGPGADGTRISFLMDKINEIERVLLSQ